MAAALDRDRARDLHCGGKLYLDGQDVVSCLHAMHSTTLFNANEAIETLLALSDDDFWRIGHEVALLLRDRPVRHAQPG